MISKTLLATSPRHRPTREAIASGWREFAPGRWMHGQLTVALEADGLWHSYVSPTESARTSPGYYAIPEAMVDADKRAERMLRTA